MNTKFTFLIFGLLLIIKPSLAQNPLLEPFDTPHGIIPFDKVEPEHILPAFNVALEEDRKQVQAIIDNSETATFNNIIAAYAKIGRNTGMISGYANAMAAVNGNPEIYQTVGMVSHLSSAFSNELLFNEKLFERVKEVYLQKESLSLTPEELTLLENYYRWFARNGNDLSEKEKERLKEIRSRLTELSTIFGQNAIQDRDRTFFHLTQEEDLAGLPERIIASAAEYAKSKNTDGWAFPISGPSTGDFMRYADNRASREKLLKLSWQIGNNPNEFNNLDIAKELLNLRLEMAQLLGYNSFAEYELEESMAETPEQVMTFLDTFKDKVKPIAEKEIENLHAFAISQGFDDVIRHWDFAYFNRKYREGIFEFNTDEVKPWLPVGHAIEEIFSMVSEMWGLEFRENQSLPKMHPQMLPYEVFDANGDVKAVLYLDLYERAGKVGGAFAGAIRAQNKESGQNEIPLIGLVCNFRNPSIDNEAFLSLGELSTFLHELGHALHYILSDVTYRNLSGTNLKYSDFIEVPSMLLEKWAYEPDFLARVGRHYQTGEALPQEMIDKIIRNEKEGRALSEMRLTIADAALDIALHDMRMPFEGDLCGWERDFTQNYSLFPSVENACYIPSFRHIFSNGYASGYYTYTWSDMMSWDIFNEFRKNGIFDPTTAKRLEKEILSKGGTVHPGELFKNFMGRDMSINAFLESFDDQ
ncbi:peptidyl-dipeptidase Dcp [Belliella buryatensis]|uniref:Peptidyl-dipeptidase Dcp n=1 Tax=Belliella buryatensis TaxID=1500549 RepID=A0A239CQE1_9BACT|nr:M3 family metallopeptidase [Belliella buryatensis]SNS22327.1 peptidyl-dipeptidase Dcp [Belliella buryatensis]